MNEYKVIIVESDPDFGETLKLMLDYSFEFDAIGIFKNSKAIGSTALPDADIVLAKISDLKELDKLKNIFSATPIVAVVSDESDQFVVKLLTSGSAHYVFKGSEPAIYLNTLKEVLTNQIKIKDSVIKKLLFTSHIPDTINIEESGLTSRETQILKLLAQGCSYRKISEELFISLETVKRHCHNIYKKLEVKNRTEAINKVLYQ